MTNKRQLKQYINRVSNEIAEVVLPSAVYAKAITNEQAEDILDNLSRLQTKTLSHLSIAFDKAPSSFENVKDYRKAKTLYYRVAYTQAIKEFEEGIDKLLAPINKAAK